MDARGCEGRPQRTVLSVAGYTSVLAAAVVTFGLVASGCSPPVSCDGAPACDPGDRRVQQCPPGESCYQESFCGNTITCVDESDPPDVCVSGVGCKPGYRIESECPDVGDCYQVGSCGGGVYCVNRDFRDTSDTCSAADVACPGNDRSVNRCPDGGSCYELSTCNGTIRCLRVSDADVGDADATDGSDTDQPCLAEPTCDPGDGRVSACPDAGSCYERTRCGSTITCLRDDPADAGDTDADTGICFPVPSCDSGDREVQYCPDGGTCYMRSGCGRSVTCLRQMQSDVDTAP